MVRKQTVPIELELFDFTLPDQNSMQAMVYYESLQPALYQGRDLDAEYHRFAHRQRIELVQSYDIAGAKRDAVASMGQISHGARGYEGPGQNVGNQIITPHFLWTWQRRLMNRSSAWREADNWMTFLRETFREP